MLLVLLVAAAAALPRESGTQLTPEGPGAPDPGPGPGGFEQERAETELIEIGRYAILISITHREIQSLNWIRTKHVSQQFMEVLHVP